MEPIAEVDISAGLIEHLVRSQCPELAGEVRIVAHGWDNVVARLGQDYVVRMPRRELAAGLIANEARWLPHIGPMVPVDVPEPVFAGRPDGDYPWAWLIARWLPGRPVTAVPVDRRALIAAELGSAHAALHRPAPPDAPANPYRGGPLSERVEVATERLSAMPSGQALRPLWDAALAAEPWARESVWLHGDAHPANLLATRDDRPRLGAIVDWGDLTAGDPAVDLAAGWLAFNATDRAAYRSAYVAAGGADDAATWVRARGWAVLLAGSMLGDGSADHAMTPVGRHAVTELLAELRTRD